MLDFSVIIPARDEEANISLCLDSIFSNHYPSERYEVIVVDNGSDDRTVDVAVARNAIVAQLPDVNISALRNQGANLARGRVLAFIDADCTVAVDWLQQASRYLDQPDIALFGSPPGIPQESTWVQRTWFLVRGRTGDHEVTEVGWLESMNMFIPRQFFFKVKGFNEELVTCEDVDISYRLAEYGRVISDLRIRATHHGEARTLREFFRKERWRGKSNYAGLYVHGLHPEEIPSLFLPVFFLFTPIVAALACLTAGSLSYLLTGFVLWQSPVGLITMLKAKGKAATPVEIIRLWLLYNVYYAARSTAVFF